MDNTKFRKLLKKGIGLRTQKQFAEQTGLAKETINRMINFDTIPRPKLKTLETLADNMNSVSREELMEACGYEVPNINEMIYAMENDIEDFFAFGEETNCYNSLTSLVEKLNAFVNKCSCTTYYNKECDISIPEKYEKKGAEDCSQINVKWKYRDLIYVTEFHVFYVISRKGQLLLIGSDIEEKWENKDKRINHTTIRSSKITPEKRLLSTIFGIDLGEITKIPTNIPGYGIEFNEEIPAGFTDFLNAHSGTFCDSTEHTDMYKRIIAGEDPDTVFQAYKYDGSDIGPCAVIAEIMSKETGRNFEFCDMDIDLSRESQNVCIMERINIPFGRIEAPDKKLINYLYDCAKILHVKKFGVVSYHSAYEVSKEYQFNIDEM